MELRTLRYFTVVARELNITRAAAALNMSQPPLSNQIKALEKELGVRLFVRGKRRLALTEEGALLLRRALEIQELADTARREIDSLRQGVGGTIRLAAGEGQAPFLAARWIAGFREMYPLVQYDLWSGDGAGERLEQGLADLAVLAAPYDAEHLEGLTAGRGPWTAILSRDHPLARAEGDTVPLADLAGEALIVPRRRLWREAVRRWFGEMGAEAKILCAVSGAAEAAALAGQGAGVGLFPQSAGVTGGLAVVKTVTRPCRQVEYVLAWNRDRSLSGPCRAFIRYARDHREEQRGTP